MAETSFEFNLERMFAETPARPDADIFAARVLERLDRGWTARRLLIGSMGALGGLVGAYQILGAGALQQLQARRDADRTTTSPSTSATRLAHRRSARRRRQAIWMAAAARAGGRRAWPGAADAGDLSHVRPASKTPVRRLTAPEITARKGGEPIVCLTAYTAPVAAMLDEVCDILLVGDSVGMVLHGLPNTVGVTLEMMILHGQAVMRAQPQGAGGGRHAVRHLRGRRRRSPTPTRCGC